jgi:hypothetical protein
MYYFQTSYIEYFVYNTLAANLSALLLRVDRTPSSVMQLTRNLALIEPDIC